MFTANAAWLVLAVIAFNLTRAAGTLSGPDLAKATTATIRRKLINVPARVATSARRLDPAPTPGLALGDTPGPSCSTAVSDPPPSPGGLTTQQRELRDPRTTVEHPDSEVR